MMKFRAVELFSGKTVVITLTQAKNLIKEGGKITILNGTKCIRHEKRNLAVSLKAI